MSSFIRRLFICVAVVLLFTILVDGAGTLNPLHEGVDSDEDGKLSQNEEIQLLRRLYANIDVNRDGRVDLRELFVDPSKRKTLKSDSNMDIAVSMDELQKFWLKSSVHEWTIEQVLVWLGSINMPQYKPNFLAKQVDGKLLPILALDEGKLLQEHLGIRNKDHARRISREIISIVFGIPPDPDRWTFSHYALVASLTALSIATGVIIHMRKQSDADKQALLQRVSQMEDHSLKSKAAFDAEISKLEATADTAQKKVKELEKERDVRTVTIKDSSHLHELLDKELADKAILQSWLQARYRDESISWAQRWRDLQDKIATSRVKVKRITQGKASFRDMFAKSNHALDHAQTIELLEAEIRHWQEGYRNFLATWAPIADLGYVQLPALDSLTGSNVSPSITPTASASASLLGRSGSTLGRSGSFSSKKDALLLARKEKESSSTSLNHAH